ncbi:hypothetical protein [Bacillus subtilis]|uniref:hypothetical protein n=1 Tax=Bacillus subtilis TaxID=1423 RepID=UPI000F471546|nr:hypothetical protein [Bacillus subtilis]MCL6427638.1 hypothetical protein [Bacillus subtilis]ROT26874.1 hypothetical protein EGD80_14225 [Bacillus subtilis]
MSKDECQTYQGNACESEGCSRSVIPLCQYRKKWSRSMKWIFRINLSLADAPKAYDIFDEKENGNI